MPSRPPTARADIRARAFYLGRQPQRNRNGRTSVSRVGEMGVLHGGEPLTLKTVVGMALTIGGIVVPTIG